MKGCMMLMCIGGSFLTFVLSSLSFGRKAIATTNLRNEARMKTKKNELIQTSERLFRRYPPRSEPKNVPMPANSEVYETQIPLLCWETASNVKFVVAMTRAAFAIPETS